MNNKKFVLMSCCAPCSAAAIKQLQKLGANFVVLFYNPNIFPHEEYKRRLDEQIKLCDKLGVKYAAPDYDHDAWLQCIKGLEGESEQGRRCAECFKMRLAWGAKWAYKNGYNAITSVFGSSPYKNQIQVDEAASGLPIKYIDCNFSFEPEPNSYRQKYCGCEFSETYDDKKA